MKIISDHTVYFAKKIVVVSNIFPMKPGKLIPVVMISKISEITNDTFRIIPIPTHQALLPVSCNRRIVSGIVAKKKKKTKVRCKKNIY
ncbi:hypothetical protein [Xylanibacter caecicola]|uniref:hypothetical protein n=1 Tax=Xylanibacter caecicola TaxID=2736294 RepID=UPI0020A6A141|nr:hypothetical protein [Xylanibacter caecicola]